MAEPGPHQLAPKELGKLVGEALALYQRDFGPFILIAFLAQIPLLLSLATPSPIMDAFLSMVGLALGVLASGVFITAVAQRYLSREIDLAVCAERAWRRGGYLLAAALIYGGVLILAALLSLIIVGIPLLFYFAVVWAFSFQAIIVEGHDPVRALERSRGLVRGSWWRVFGIGLVFALILGSLLAATVGVGVVLSEIAPTLADIFGTVAGILITPIASIGATLVYFDLRVRKEGYTMANLAAEMGG